jgi:hypothetical protein
VPTIAAAVVLVALHRIIAVVTAAVPMLERIVNGDSRAIYRGGIFGDDVGRSNRAARTKGLGVPAEAPV